MCRIHEAWAGLPSHTPFPPFPIPLHLGGGGGGGCRFAGIETYSTYYTCPWYTGTVARSSKDF